VLLDEHLPALDRAHLTTVQADGGAHLDDVAEPRVVLDDRPWLPRVIDDRHELELSDLIALERGAWLSRGDRRRRMRRTERIPPSDGIVRGVLHRLDRSGGLGRRRRPPPRPGNNERTESEHPPRPSSFLFFPAAFFFCSCSRCRSASSRKRKVVVVHAASSII